MTDEQIRELAQKYAKATVSTSGFSSDTVLELQDEQRRKAVSVLQWLSETHCIVEKSKIKTLYSKMELDGNHVDSDNDWAIYEAMDELEKIFGEELFNENPNTD